MSALDLRWFRVSFPQHISRLIIESCRLTFYRRSKTCCTAIRLKTLLSLRRGNWSSCSIRITISFMTPATCSPRRSPSMMPEVLLLLSRQQSIQVVCDVSWRAAATAEGDRSSLGNVWKDPCSRRDWLCDGFARHQNWRRRQYLG